VPEETSLRAGATDSRHGGGWCRTWRVGWCRPISISSGWRTSNIYPPAEEFAFLAIVLDAFSRRVDGWALDTHLQASLAVAALAMALVARRPGPGSLIHHSDRGVQYACGEYSALLATHDIQPGMSRIGNPTTMPRRRAL